jgi:hypothetical protein
MSKLNRPESEEARRCLAGSPSESIFVAIRELAVNPTSASARTSWLAMHKRTAVKLSSLTRSRQTIVMIILLAFFDMLVGGSTRALAATFTVDVSGGGVTGSLEIVDSTNPPTWSARTPNAFGIDGGVVTSWGAGAHNVHLVAEGIHPVLFLDGFTHETKEGDTGTGDMNWAAGKIPLGPITWSCVLKK